MYNEEQKMKEEGEREKREQGWLGSSLLQFSQNVGDVGGVGQADHDVQFLQLHVDGVVVLHVEHLDVLLQNVRPVESGGY